VRSGGAHVRALAVAGGQAHRAIRIGGAAGATRHATEQRDGKRGTRAGALPERAIAEEGTRASGCSGWSARRH
jgi:hypothetical protein